MKPPGQESGSLSSRPLLPSSPKTDRVLKSRAYLDGAGAPGSQLAVETGVTRWIGRSVVSTMEARRKNRPAGTPGGSRTNGTPCCFSPSLDLLWVQVNRRDN